MVAVQWGRDSEVVQWRGEIRAIRWSKTGEGDGERLSKIASHDERCFYHLMNKKQETKNKKLRA